MSIKKYSSGQWVDVPYRKFETATDTFTTLPTEIIGDGQSASAVIKGNMQQSGTPTPSAPIYPQECGDKTANLCDYSKFESTNTTITIITNGINLTGKYFARYRISLDINTAYAMNWVSEVISGTPDIAWRIQYTDNTYSAFANKGSSLTPTKAVLGILLYVTQSDATASVNFTNIMLSSPALPYEPYGYKIPISSANTTTPVYLGEVQTTRQIKKIVFDGTENWKLSSTTYQFYMDSVLDAIPFVAPMCTDFNGVSSLSGNNEIMISETQKINIRTTYIQHNLTNWINYLQQRYAAGKPVTVWYVLATETTGIVNEPIRKIGDYADSVTGTGIPTTGTAEQFDVDTTLKPSEVDLTYHGWHPHSDTVFTE